MENASIPSAGQGAEVSGQQRGVRGESQRLTMIMCGRVGELQKKERKRKEKKTKEKRKKKRKK